MPSRTYVRIAVRSSMPIARRKPDPDGITTARLAGTAGRYVRAGLVDVDDAIRERQGIAGGRDDLLAEQAGLTLGAHPRRAGRDLAAARARGRAVHRRRG